MKISYRFSSKTGGFILPDLNEAADSKLPILMSVLFDSEMDEGKNILLKNNFFVLNIEIIYHNSW